MSPENPEPLRVLREFSVTKRDDSPNEDRWHVSLDKTCCAISDGASVSFDSGPWAEILCKKFVESAEVSPAWLAEAVAKYQASYDREVMSWSHQASFDRGSSATLLGVVCSADARLARVFAVGDSLMAFIENGQLVKTFPYSHPDEFDNSPVLFSTSSAENLFFDDEAAREGWYDLIVASHEKPMLLLMTDALGRWLLDDPSQDRVSMLTAIDDEASFSEFVVRERSDGRLKRDDSTLIVIG